MIWLFGDIKDLNRRTATDKVLHDKVFDIAKDPRYDGYQSGLASMIHNFFGKITSGGGIKNIPNKELAEELHKPIIRKSNKRKLHSPFIDNIWGAGLAYMQLIGKFNKGFRFLLCVFHIYSEYAQVIALKGKKGITITNAFQKFLDESNRIPNKIWVDKGSEFYSRSMKSWLEKSDKEMYSTCNEEKSVIAERFIRTLKNKYLTLVSKNVYIDKLDDIVSKYNNTYHSTIKVKPVDVKSSTHIDSSKEINGDGDVRISKQKNIFAKGYVLNWS